MKEVRSKKPRVIVRILLLTLSLCLLAGGLLFPQQTLKVDVNLVNVFATVKDEHGDFVNNLDREDFRLYEDDQLQDIQIFEKQNRMDSSIGILMDTSGSMVDILPFIKKGIRDFTRALPHNNEFFITSFGSDVKLIHKSSQSEKHLDESMQNLRAWGTSLMFDALLDSITKIEETKHPRKALIVFSDGNDNGSRTGYGEVVEESQRSAVLLYFVAIGSQVLVDTHTVESLANISGGQTFYVAKQAAISSVLDEIRTELSQQYYLGYYATRQPGFHRIRVEVSGHEVMIRAKTGYVY